jgi:hypothetical protein
MGSIFYPMVTGSPSWRLERVDVTMFQSGHHLPVRKLSRLNLEG